MDALRSNTAGGSNTANRSQALYSNTTGSRNIALGWRAGYNQTTGDDNIVIGNEGIEGDAATIRIGTSGLHKSAYLAGVRDVRTGLADGIPVLIDSNGQLGTGFPLARDKEEVRDIGDSTSRLLELRPVLYRRKPDAHIGEWPSDYKLANGHFRGRGETEGSESPIEYGLIPEEVAEIFPELVFYDEQGQPFAVKHHLLSFMLLNELQRHVQQKNEEIENLRIRVAHLETLIQSVSGERAADFLGRSKDTHPAVETEANPPTTRPIRGRD